MSKLTLTMNKTALGMLLCFINCIIAAAPVIDENVTLAFNEQNKSNYVSLLVFFGSEQYIPQLIEELTPFRDASIEQLTFMPVVIVTSHIHDAILNKIITNPFVTYLALNTPAGEKTETTSLPHKPQIQSRYPGLNLWWANNFKGQSGVVGIIDSGIASDHSSLSAKKIIINQNEGSNFSKYPDGVRSPHGTGVACIYAGNPLENKRVRGVAYAAPVILSTLAGEGNKTKENFWLTFSSLNWLLSQNQLKPSVINYSFGNGIITCPSCPDWSGMSKIVDYIVNQQKILWVTSAGNNGYIIQKKNAPFESTMTVPADNYNAITVANMNMYSHTQDSRHKCNREHHAIRYTSSRGPTLSGRKKPDITAPGNDTFTCAPNPEKYHINYSHEMKYANGYRLMGGTSSAAPHVGGAILLIQEAAITNPVAIKALLINSADTWTDSNKPGPNDRKYRYNGGHSPIKGSEWNPTYGWGYINMESAFYQKDYLVEDKLTLKHPVLEYKIKISAYDKITVVHERRVGFNHNGSLWQLSHIKLELLDINTHQILATDDSPIDTVHQVSLNICKKLDHCLPNEAKNTLVRVSLLSTQLEGATEEPVAIAFPVMHQM